MAHHLAAEMVGMVVRDQDLVDFVALALRELENRADIPGRINDRGLVGLGIADQVDEIRHRAELGLPEIELGLSRHRIDLPCQKTSFPIRRGRLMPCGSTGGRARIDPQAAIPEELGLAEPLRHPARLHEQMVAQAIEIDQQLIADGSSSLDVPAYPLSAPAYRAGLMQEGIEYRRPRAE